jgi:hypothetical protein
MISMLWMAAFAPLAHADCDDFATLVQSAETAVSGGRVDEAAATLRQAELSLACSPVPSPALLGRMWLAEGTRAYMQGDEKVSRLAFAAAARVAPDLWIDSYGPAVEKIYRTASSHDSGNGSVRIHPNPDGWSTTLDGSAVSFPADAPSGLHLLQVGRSADQTDYAEIFFLPRDDTYFVLTGLEDNPIATVAQVEPEPPVEPTPPVEPEAPAEVEPPAVAEVVPVPLEAQPLPDPTPAGPGFSSPVFLVVGGAAAVVAGGTAIGALAQNSRMEYSSELTLDSHDRTFARQKALGYTSYGMMGLAAAGLGLHFALTF